MDASTNPKVAIRIQALHSHWMPIAMFPSSARKPFIFNTNKIGSQRHGAHTGATMKRPGSVILTAILLGLFAAFNLLGTAGMAGMGFHPPQRPAGPTAPDAVPAFLHAHPLLRDVARERRGRRLVNLHPRRSGPTALLGALLGPCRSQPHGWVWWDLDVDVLRHALSRILLGHSTGVDLSHLRVVFVISGVIYGILTAIGVTWLIYFNFNLANTRALFFQSAHANLTPPNTSAGRSRPTAITVISWLYMATAPFCLIYLFLPFPGFLFGFIIYGAAAHLLYATFGVVNFVLGYGLYRLWNWARLCIYAMFGFGLINTLVLLTPWGHSQFHAYMDAFNAHIYS